MELLNAEKKTVSSPEVEKSEDLFSNGTPQREGYEFAGWYVDPQLTRRLNPEVQLPHEVKLYPKWEPKWFEIAYVLEQGVNSPDNHHMYSFKTGLTKLFPASCEGLQFAGWYLDGKRVDYIDPTWCRNVELVGRFIEHSTVSFETGKGSRVPSVSTDGQGMIRPPFDPMRPGYDFAGWYIDEAMTMSWNENMRFEEDAIMYAKWKAHEYEIALNASVPAKDADPEEDIYILKYTIETPTFTFPMPKREGYCFTGWADASGKLHWTVRKGTIGNLSLHATWIQGPMISYDVKVINE